MPVLSRRAALSWLALAGVEMFARPARARSGSPSTRFRVDGAQGGRLASIKRDAHGTTLTFSLENAPFPAPGAPYDDPTVIAFVPRHYRLPRHGQLDAVIHFHGHDTTALQAIEQHRLREQLADSRQNAILIVPQGPVRAADSRAGKLEQAGGLSRMLAELLDELKRTEPSRALGATSLAKAASFRTLCLSSHSGGYHAAAACLDRGGVEVSEVYLFDSLYGDVEAFRGWVVSGRERPRKSKRRRRKRQSAVHKKLISYYATDPVRENNLALMRQLEAAGVPVLHEQRPGQLSRAELTDGSAIFIASPLDHGSVTYRHNDLRDCLYASCLRRRLKSNWFARKDGARPIDERD